MTLRYRPICPVAAMGRVRSWATDTARPPPPACRRALITPMTSPRARSTTGPPDMPGSISSSSPSRIAAPPPAVPRSRVVRPVISRIPRSSVQPKYAASSMRGRARSVSHTQACETGARTRIRARSGRSHRAPRPGRRSSRRSGSTHSTRPATVPVTAAAPGSPAAAPPEKKEMPTSRPTRRTAAPPSPITCAHVRTQPGAMKKPLPHVGPDQWLPGSAYPSGAACTRTVAARTRGSRSSKARAAPPVRPSCIPRPLRS